MRDTCDADGSNAVCATLRPAHATAPVLQQHVLYEVAPGQHANDSFRFCGSAPHPPDECCRQHSKPGRPNRPGRPKTEDRRTPTRRRNAGELIISKIVFLWIGVKFRFLFNIDFGSSVAAALARGRAEAASPAKGEQAAAHLGNGLTCRPNSKSTRKSQTVRPARDPEFGTSFRTEVRGATS